MLLENESPFGCQVQLKVCLSLKSLYSEEVAIVLAVGL